MKKPKDYFNQDTRSGAVRIEGIIVMVIAYWIERGGFRDVELHADSCDFSTLVQKRDDTVGAFILAKHDYVRDMMFDLWNDPQSKFMLDMLSLDTKGVHSNMIPRDQIRYALQRYIGQHLFDSGWWDRHEGRITKDRSNFKEVKKVMES